MRVGVIELNAFEKRLFPRLDTLIAKLRRFAAVRPKRALKLCDSVSLGDKRFVAVVQFERKRFLVGCAQNSVSLLTVLQDDEPVAFRESLAVAQGGNA
jgi:flagellar biogenesis protein FliO